MRRGLVVTAAAVLLAAAPAAAVAPPTGWNGDNPFLCELQQGHPDVSVALTVSDTQRIVELVARTHHAHASASPSGRRFDDQREADLIRIARWNDGDAVVAGDPFRLELVAAGPQCIGRRADPRQLGRVDGRGEVGALRKESITRMDRVGAGLLRSANVFLGEEIARNLDDLVGGARV